MCTCNNIIYYKQLNKQPSSASSSLTIKWDCICGSVLFWNKLQLVKNLISNKQKWSKLLCTRGSRPFYFYTKEWVDEQKWDSPRVTWYACPCLMQSFPRFCIALRSSAWNISRELTPRWFLPTRKESARKVLPPIHVNKCTVQDWSVYCSTLLN